jgi:hypothetical protein
MYESKTLQPGQQQLISWPTVGINGVTRAYLVLGSVGSGTEAYVVIGNAQGERVNETIPIPKGGRSKVYQFDKDTNYAVVINAGDQQLLVYTEAWRD